MSDPRFNEIFTSPENDIFKVVFFPDRIYHEAYLNATRSPRYRYNVQEVRGYLDISVLKGEVYLDGVRMSNFVRLEYRGSRLVEQVRLKSRLLRGQVLAWMKLQSDTASAESRLVLHWDDWVGCYQAECWDRLEPPETVHHDFAVRDQMGAQGPITRIQALTPLIGDVRAIRRVELAFREPERYHPYGTFIDDATAAWDNNLLRSHQVPNTDQPSSPANTVEDRNYLLDFQRGWFRHARDILPVRYRNAMMDATNPDADPANVIAMKWLFQRELGGSMIFFHEVTLPPGKVEGNHQHVGSEELYFVTQGRGVAYLRVGDDPATDGFPTVTRHVMGLGQKEFKEVPVEPGSMIFTKSGGMHGIRNPHPTEDLKFIAFLYQSR